MWEYLWPVVAIVIISVFGVVAWWCRSTEEEDEYDGLEPLEPAPKIMKGLDEFGGDM